MKTYGGKGSIAPHIRNLNTKWLRDKYQNVDSVTLRLEVSISLVWCVTISEKSEQVSQN
jgi:hypothetical protein